MQRRTAEKLTDAALRLVASSELVVKAALIVIGYKEYPKAGSNLGGLKVGSRIDNQSSIDADLNDYTILPGVRKVPLSDFDVTDPYKLYYAKNDIDRVKELVTIIKDNRRIDPLIVVLDNKGPYVLEGGHRLAALHTLGAKHLPALIVLDNEALGLASADLSNIRSSVQEYRVQPTTARSLKRATASGLPIPSTLPKATKDPELLTLQEAWNKYAETFKPKAKAYTTDEYKTVYPYLKELNNREKKNFKAVGEKAMKEIGVWYGDEVEWHAVGGFFDLSVYNGVIVKSTKGPRVKLESPIGGKKSLRWHKGFKKA